MVFLNMPHKGHTIYVSSFIPYNTFLCYSKQARINSIILSCSSHFILLSLGKQTPLAEMSIPTSATPPAIYAYEHNRIVLRTIQRSWAIYIKIFLYITTYINFIIFFNHQTTFTIKSLFSRN